MALSLEENAPKCTTFEPSRIKGLKKSVKNFTMAGLSRILVQKNKNAPLLFQWKTAKKLIISGFLAVLRLINTTRVCPTQKRSGAFFVHGIGNAPLKNFNKMHQNCKNPNLTGF